MRFENPIDRYRLSRSSSALLIVDVQERLCAAMEPILLDRMLRRTRAAIEGAKALELPIVLTEQYPKGLGPTHRSIKALLPQVEPIPKLQFSCVTAEGLSALQRPQILIAGMETHVCVFQTARDLLVHQRTPYILADAVLSRTPEDRDIGLSLCH